MAPETQLHALQTGGFPRAVEVDGKRINLTTALSAEGFHHYIYPRVSTQYASFTQKRRGDGSGEWMAHHEIEHHEVFQKLSDVLQREKAALEARIPTGAHRGVWLAMYYPIVVLQGRLLEARPSKRSVSLTNSNHIRFRRAVPNERYQTIYQYDVVTERYFSRLLDAIEKETCAIGDFLAIRISEPPDNASSVGYNESTSS